ncbi:MAG TPA: hypothetical protein VJT15_25505 [Pyrinomonadaceae bacterium]|nr:hypothetical protein [Pyrinomonadaceae bacterium]
MKSNEILAIIAEKTGIARKSQDDANGCIDEMETEPEPVKGRCIRYGNGVTDIVNDSVTPFVLVL